MTAARRHRGAAEGRPASRPPPSPATGLLLTLDMAASREIKQCLTRGRLKPPAAQHSSGNPIRDPCGKPISRLFPTHAPRLAVGNRPFKSETRGSLP